MEVLGGETEDGENGSKLRKWRRWRQRGPGGSKNRGKPCLSIESHAMKTSSDNNKLFRHCSIRITVTPFSTYPAFSVNMADQQYTEEQRAAAVSTVLLRSLAWARADITVGCSEYGLGGTLATQHCG